MAPNTRLSYGRSAEYTLISSVAVSNSPSQLVTVKVTSYFPTWVNSLRFTVTLELMTPSAGLVRYEATTMEGFSCHVNLHEYISCRFSAPRDEDASKYRSSQAKLRFLLSRAIFA